MSGIVGFVFIVTMLNCVFGLIDRSGFYAKAAGTLRSSFNFAAQAIQAIKRRRKVS